MSTITNLDNENPDQFNWRRDLPIWAIPQLAFLRDRLGIHVKSFTPETILDHTRKYNKRTDSAVVRIYLPTDHAYYLFRIHKVHMNNPNHVPPMFEVL